MKSVYFGVGVLALASCFCGWCLAQQEIPPADSLYVTGLRSMQKNDLGNAKVALSMLVLHYPNDERQGMVYLVLAQVYLKEGDFFAAKLALEGVLERYAASKDSSGRPILPAALTYLGAIHDSIGQQAAARRVYEKLKRENAGHGPVRTAECTTFGTEECLILFR
jgi:outer membrane protein assembly factor BamD (BamD/ComL family)